MNKVSRRSLTKGAVWAAPAVAVAGAAPAMAASCTPTTVNEEASIHWVSSQSGYEMGDVEIHHTVYTFTNTGAAVLPAGADFMITLSYTTVSGNPDGVSLTGNSSNVSVSTATTSHPNADDSSNVDYTDTIKVVTTQDVAVNGVMTVNLDVTYGLLLAGVDESVTNESPVSRTVGCVTTLTAIPLSGASDGTTYTSPGDGGSAGG